MQAIDLPAGRELDALIAEQVMGYQWMMHKPGLQGSEIPGQRFLYPIDGPAARDGFYVPAPLDAPIANGFHVPYFSTELDAAWRVVEKIDLLDAWYLRHPSDWIVVEFDQDREQIIAVADTAPLVICLAALVAAQMAARMQLHD